MKAAKNYRYIMKTEGVRGGNARIEGTRIGVHDKDTNYTYGHEFHKHELTVGTLV